MSCFIAFIHGSILLLFLLSGSGTWFALSFRSAGEYVQERSSGCLSLSIWYRSACSTSSLLPTLIQPIKTHTCNSIHSSSMAFVLREFWVVAPVVRDLSFRLFIGCLPLFLHLKGGAHLLSKLSVGMENWSNLATGSPLAAIALRSRWPGFQNLYDDWANLYTFCILSTATSQVLTQDLDRL